MKRIESKRKIIEMAIEDCARLSKTIEKIHKEEITKENKKEIQKALQNIKAKIDNILDFVNK